MIDIKCNFCQRKVANLITAEKSGWVWFTGYLKNTVYVCPHCQQHHAAAVAALMLKANVKAST